MTDILINPGKTDSVVLVVWKLKKPAAADFEILWFRQLKK